MRWQLSTSRDCTITDMHILSGSLWICSQPSQSPSYSFVRSTVNPTRNLNNSFPIFYFTENSADTISSHDCINFGDCGRETLSWVKPPEPVVFSIAQNAKNLINWGSVSLEAIPRLTALPCYAFIAPDTNKRISYVFNFGRMPNLILVPDGTTKPIFSPYFNDRNLAPETKMPTKGTVFIRACGIWMRDRGACRPRQYYYIRARTRTALRFRSM